MILRDFISRWRDLVPMGFYKDSTWANYSSHINRYLLPDLGDKQIEDVNALTVQEYITTLQKRGLGAKTVRNILMTMRVLWKSAIAWRMVHYSPFQGLMLPRVNPKERIVFTLNQIRDIISMAPPPSNLFFWIAAETGMRAGELCALRGEDFDHDRGVLYVRQSLWSGRLQLPKTKNSIRSCSISSQLNEKLWDYLQRKTAGAPGGDRVRFLFTTVRGYPWNPTHIVAHQLRPVLDALGLPRTGLHSFRHSAATLADQANLPLKTRQARLGHADIRLTMDTYTHKNIDSTAEDSFVNWLGSTIDLPKSVQ